MTTYFPFTPSKRRAPTYQMRFDGALYRVSVLWNLFGQRFYVKAMSSSTGKLIFNVALTPSLPALSLNSLAWNVATLRVSATTVTPHGFKLGTVVRVTIDGASPSGYNGAFYASITGPSSFTYALGIDPGTVVSFGTVSYIVNMIAGYFKSTLIFRNGQFEVSP